MSETRLPEPEDALEPETRDLITRLDSDLNDARRHGERAVQQMHKVMLRQVRAAERRARRAEQQVRRAKQRARRAERRAARLERELAAIRASSTWKAGRALVAVPGKIKNWRKS